MSKSIKNIKTSEKKIILEALYQSARHITGQYPTVTFIDELLTESEKVTLGRRVLIAQMILAGDTRMEIQNKLGVSPNTIAQTRKWLSTQMPSYNSAIEQNKEVTEKRRLARTKKTKQQFETYDQATFQGLRKKYPAHFLLFNLAEELLNRIQK